MVVQHSIFGKDMEKNDEIQELLATIDRCRKFLLFWKVYVAHRTEPAEVALLAISELERECRVRLDWLTLDDEEEIIPF